MSHLPFTLAAYLLNSISVTIDKFLLTKSIPDPFSYVFYFSTFSLLALLALPLTHYPSEQVLLLASISTLLWTFGAFLMFKALQNGELSRIIPIIGTLISLFLLFEAIFYQSINLDQIWAVIILILGLVFLTFVNWRGKFLIKELTFEFFSALLFACSYLFLRQAYLRESFLTVFVYSRLVLIPVGIIFFLIPFLRSKILAKGPKRNLLSKTGILFLLGQSAGGSAELLLTFSISLATPALVNSLQGVQYAFLFIFSLILGKRFGQIYYQSLSKMAFFLKVLGLIFIGFGLYILAFSNSVSNPQLGLTYSLKEANDLNLNPQKTYDMMLNDLHPKYIRLPIYWDQIEKSFGIYDLFSLDYYFDQAAKKGAKVIPVIGMKVPRWPECFIPQFDQNLTVFQKQQRILELIKAEVNYLKDYSAIEAWQVENEPFLTYGDCPKPDANFLQNEIALVKSIDHNRPILITDSGELSTWIPAAQSADWLGVTMYRMIWDKFLGYFNYPIPAFVYNLKSNLAKFLAPQIGKTFVVELQAEPWAPDKLQLSQMPPQDQISLFPAEKIKDNLNFAKRTNFSRVYLWGVEWWYAMKDKNHPEYLETVKNYFSLSN